MPANQWTEIKVCVPTGWQELVAEALQTSLCTSVQVGDHSIASEPPPANHLHVRSYVLTDQDTPQLRAAVTRNLKALAQADEQLAGLNAQFKVLPPEDYATSWKKSWKPFRLRSQARALRVIPPWEQDPQSEELQLILEPGGAFGSGRHATTRTCMAVLLERIQGGERVLDAGMGSGILAVCALLLGAGSAHGFDIDPVATQSANELAQANSVAEQTHFATGGFECCPQGPFDVVLANIYADIISIQAPHLASALAPGGWFAFSGCPAHHEASTRRAIQKAGLAIQETRQRGRWFTFVGQRA